MGNLQDQHVGGQVLASSHDRSCTEAPPHIQPQVILCQALGPADVPVKQLFHRHHFKIAGDGRDISQVRIEADQGRIASKPLSPGWARKLRMAWRSSMVFAPLGRIGADFVKRGIQFRQDVPELAHQPVVGRQDGYRLVGIAPDITGGVLTHLAHLFFRSLYARMPRV